MSWASSDLLSRFNSFAGRPSADEITDATKYQWLAQAQQEVYDEIATKVPQALYGSPTALSTADSGKTWTFASSILPIGHVEIYPALNAIPDSPLIEGVDYLAEGPTIRIPNDRAWTATSTLNGRYIATPADITSSTQPSLLPVEARELIVFKGVEVFSATVRDFELEDRMAVRYGRALSKWLLKFKTQYFTQGSGSRRLNDPNGWYLGNPDLG